MKKYFSLFFILMMTAVTYAQTVGTTARELAQLSRQVARAAEESTLQMQMLRTAGVTGGQAFQLTKQLETNAQAALDLARTAKKREPLCYMSQGTYPVVDMNVKSKWAMRPYHRAMPDLKKAKNIALYAVAQENHLVAQEMKRLEEQVWKQIWDNMDRLEQAAANTPQVADPLRFVVENLPSSVNTLFVGEVHRFPEIQEAMHRLLTLLREQQPDRQIILLTEFLPKDFVWEGNIPANFKGFSDYAVAGFFNKNKLELWKYARELNIPSVGLEPIQSCLSAELHPLFLLDNRFTKREKISLNESLSGMKYRNKNFVGVLQSVREKFPDALFVVYTGSAHVEYNAFDSVSSHFKPEKTFVLDIFPSVQRVAQKVGTSNLLFARNLGHPIRQYILEGDFPQNFQFFDKELAPIAGVDAFIRLETPKK